MGSSLMIIVAILGAIWVFSNATRRGISKTTAYVLALISALFPYAILIYIVYIAINPATPISAGKKTRPKPRREQFKAPSILCPKCGSDNSHQATHCAQCGNQLTL